MQDLPGQPESNETLPPGGPSTDASGPAIEELPPVEPPSAGFIIQLFLIPALIVAAVIGVWVLFGKLADSETDWQQLVAELGSGNEHRRWRSALVLAQILRNEQIAGPTADTKLADNPEVAQALADLLKESLDSRSTLEDDIKHQEFLARTLGSIHVDEVTLPVLATALTSEYETEVRKSALMSVAMIAGRHFESETKMQSDPSEEFDSFGTAPEKPLDSQTIRNEEVLNQLKLAAQDEDPAIRHLAAFVFGLVSGQKSVETLEVMLLDGDQMTRANAAVGLARNGSAAGIDTFIELLEAGAKPMDRSEFQNLSPEEQQEELAKRSFEQPIILRNSLRAVSSLWPQIPAEQQQRLQAILAQLAEDGAAADIRLQADTLLKQTQQSGE